MDLIRIFVETSFADIAERFCNNITDKPEFDMANLLIDEASFVDECRIHHKELSDDQIRMIYGLYRDDWSEPVDGSDSENPENKNIFNVVCRLSNELLRDMSGIPKVKFQHLFRWREVSQVLGEDIFTMALLAYEKRHQSEDRIQFQNFEKIPSVLHNDNPHLHYIFSTVRLCELHSHLKAATDNFAISWVCLMNHISRQSSHFKKLAKIQDPSREDYIANKIYNAVAEAAYIRFRLWQFISKGGSLPKFSDEYSLETKRIELDKSTSAYRTDPNDYDYIYAPNSRNMSIFVGERKFLYLMFSKVLRTNDIIIHKLFYRYLLRKNQFRSFMVQINDNTGFGNFKRFQDLKSTFLTPKYNELLSILPIWEACVFNYNKVYEARVAPVNKPSEFKELYRKIKDELKNLNDIEVSILFHFIKTQENKEIGLTARDFKLRYDNLHNSIRSKHIRDHAMDSSMTSAIDAASSELYCRPEVFAQSFRFLKYHGYFATFHAGEDFYDLADGLRSIDEAIWFLGLEAGDRIGHAIALGLNPIRFYSLRHNYIAIPQQWMLDNVVWLYCYSRKHNITISPAAEHFILDTYKLLLWTIGYQQAGSGNIDISDYYQSMLLRGDNPNYYKQGVFNKRMRNESISDSDSWRSFDLQQHKGIDDIRKYNTVAVRLYSDYHFNMDVRRKGKLIKAYHLPDGYPNLILELQNKMIQEISKCRLGIECCPSSNFRIGHLEKFENHPIFRFMPVHEPESRYPLPVTVNTDDLGIFATSLPNEFSLLALALLKKKDDKGNHVYSSQEVYDWIKRVVENGHKYHFKDDRVQVIQNNEDDDN